MQNAKAKKNSSSKDSHHKYFNQKRIKTHFDKKN